MEIRESTDTICIFSIHDWISLQTEKNLLMRKWNEKLFKKMKKEMEQNEKSQTGQTINCLCNFASSLKKLVSKILQNNKWHRSKTIRSKARIINSPNFILLYEIFLHTIRVLQEKKNKKSIFFSLQVILTSIFAIRRSKERRQPFHKPSSSVFSLKLFFRVSYRCVT